MIKHIATSTSSELDLTMGRVKELLLPRNGLVNAPSSRPSGYAYRVTVPDGKSTWSTTVPATSESRAVNTALAKYARERRLDPVAYLRLARYSNAYAVERVPMN